MVPVFYALFRENAPEKGGHHERRTAARIPQDRVPRTGRIQKSVQLERALQISGNELRRLVHRLRKRGVPIASSRDGYFYAVTAGEVYTTIRQLRQMACGLEKAIAGLEGSLAKFGPGGGDP